MESLDFKTFISQTHPFETLSKGELELVIESIDIAYYREDELILSSKSEIKYFYIIAKGVVKEVDSENEEHFYGAKDCFDIKAILSSKSESEFITAKESIIFLLPKSTIERLFEINRNFKNSFLLSVSEKIDRLLREDDEFMIDKIEDSYIHRAIFVASNSSIFEAVKKMSEAKISSILVEFENSEIGIVTDSDLRERVILQNRNYSSPIGDIASKNLISINYDDFLYNALLLMTEHSLKRLLVKKDGKIIGTIKQLDLLSSFSHKSHLISTKIDKANSILDLKALLLDLTDVITSLQNLGVKVRHITKLVTQLNSKIYKRVFEFTFPKELHSDLTLIVLGSEGRGEQTLKSDQDNALILKNGLNYLDIEKFAKDFSSALMECGFPECKGGVMVNNPLWCKSLNSHKKSIFEMVDRADSESLMNLAILIDSSYIVGNRELFKLFRESLFEAIESHPTTLANFAKATLNFETPLTFFHNFIFGKDEHKNELDLKKGAIFPIVHSIRSLSIEHKIDRVNTIERIKELNNQKIIPKDFAKELIEAFNFLLTLKLREQLKKEGLKEPLDNYINPKELSKLERDLLIDILKLVDELKKFISYHFKLSMVS